MDCRPGRALNIAHEAVDRHASGAMAHRVAIRWLGRNGSRREITYAQLREATNRFANAFAGLGVGKGHREFVLLGRIPELYIALLGALKHGCVVSPLFSAFGREPIATRMNLGAGRVLVTTFFDILGAVVRYGVGREVRSIRRPARRSARGYAPAPHRASPRRRQRHRPLRRAHARGRRW